MKTKYFTIGLLIVVLTVIATAIIFPHLPERVPVHWNGQNQPDRYGSKWEDILIAPAIMLALIGLMAALPWLSPKNFEVNGAEPVYLQMMLLVLGFMTFIHFQLLAAALGMRTNFVRLIIIAVCALFAAKGLLLPRMRRNFYLGVRTPWTLASDRVWQATHRFAGKTFFIGGFIALLVALVVRSMWPPFSVLMVAALAPVIHSLVYYKQLERRGEV